MQPDVPRLWLFSSDPQTRLELEWTAGRAGCGGEVAWFADADDLRDSLILRVREHTLPYLLVLDLRKRALAGSAVLKWAAASPSLAPVLLVALVAAQSSESFLQLLGADLVVTTLPDAAKLRQLYGIAAELARNPPPESADGLPPARRVPPAPPGDR